MPLVIETLQERPPKSYAADFLKFGYDSSRVMASLRSNLIRLAHARPELREHLLPLLSKTGSQHVNAMIRALANQLLGREDRDWNEHSRGDTFGIVVPDDQGTWPGRGDGRFTNIPNLLRSKGKKMPSNLPHFMQALHKELTAFMKQPEEQRNTSGTNKVSLRWQDNDGEAEEWSVQLSKQYLR